MLAKVAEAILEREVGHERARPAGPRRANNAEHGQAHAAAKTAIENAIECGRLLLEAKSQVAHGEWLPWIEANLSFGPRQAQKYIRLADHAAVLPNANCGSHLSINAALELIAEAPSCADYIRSALGLLDKIRPLFVAAKAGDREALRATIEHAKRLSALREQGAERAEQAMRRRLIEAEPLPPRPISPAASRRSVPARDGPPVVLLMMTARPASASARGKTARS